MKKHFLSAIGKKAFTLAAFVIIFCSSAKTYALSDTSAGVAKPSYITYQGLKDNYLVFKVDYKNELAKPFQLVIKNEHNDILYKKMFDAKPFSTDILLTEVPDNSKLTFSIETGKNNFSQSFTIDTEVKTTEEYIVKGL